MAGVQASTEGIPEMIRTLKQIDPELRKEAAREVRSIGKSVAADAKAQIFGVPLSGWAHKGRTGFEPASVRRGISARIKFTAKKTQNEIPLMTLVQKDAAGQIFDMAGRKNGSSQFVRSLPGSASRYMWPTVERNLPRVEAALLEAANKMAETINRQTGGTS